jgi:phosphate transport system ATP-binding protein
VDNSSSTAALTSPFAGGESVEFTDSAVVQVVGAGGSAPLVTTLYSAVVVVTDLGVSATDRDLSWSWRFDELDDVIHGRSEPWTVFVIGADDDFGVSVPGDRVAEFRRLVDARSTAHRGVARTAPVAPTSPPVAAASFAAPTAESVLLIADPQSAPNPPAKPMAAPAPAIEPARTARTSGGPTELVATDVSAWFGTHHVLDRVSLTMPAGRVTALIGPSGCGKSTFLRILNRMHEMIPGASLAGEVRLAGEDIYDADRKLTDARRNIGMVFQKPNPFPAMSIYDNVIASFRLTGVKAHTVEKDAVVEECLTKAGLWREVRDRLRQPGGGLSGGQQQRLCIARALAIRPKVLLMDEPCSALDPTSTRRIEETIEQLSSELTIVIVTHNMQQALRVSHQCAFFLAEQGTPGVIVEHGPTKALFSDPQDQRTEDYVNGRFG